MDKHINHCSSMSVTHSFLCTTLPFDILRCRTARQPLTKCTWGGGNITGQLITVQSFCQESFCLRICRCAFSPLGAENNKALLSPSVSALLSLSCFPSDGARTWPCSHSSKGWRRGWTMRTASGQGAPITSSVKLLRHAEERRRLN